VSWEGAGLPDFDPSDPMQVAREEQMNRMIAVTGRGSGCPP
jgi:hypothetical protein